MNCQALIRGEMKPVKNLGWLRRHWKEVGTFKVTKNRDKNWESLLEAFNNQGVIIYQTDFASNSILLWFLDRSIFRGLSLDWYGIKTTCGDKETFKLIREVMTGDSLPEQWLLQCNIFQD